MRIRHYITLDTGSGPTSLVEVSGERDAMVRIVHGARFDRTREVDAAAARAMVERMPDLASASTDVAPAHAAMLAEQTLAWASANMAGETPRALRWTAGGEAATFRTAEEAAAYDAARADDPAPAPRRRRSMMG